MLAEASDADLRACFFNLLEGYDVIHSLCGKACCGKPDARDSKTGSIQCPNGCSGSWPFPGVLRGETTQLHSRAHKRDELFVAPIMKTDRPMELFWDYSTKVPHSRFVEVTDPKRLMDLKKELLATARATTRKAMAGR